MVAALLAFHVALMLIASGWFCYHWAQNHGMQARRWMWAGLCLGPLSLILLILATPWSSDRAQGDDGGERVAPAPPRPPRLGPSHGAQHPRVRMPRRSPAPRQGR